MSQYLSCATLVAQVKDQMSGQAPADSKILRAIDAEVRNLSTKYDIDSFMRNKTVNVVTDGSVEYKIDTLVPSLDVRKVKSIRYSTNDKTFGLIKNVEFEDFMLDVESSQRKNQFTTYFKDGFLYIRVMTNNFSSDEEEMILGYLTSALAIDASGNFYTNNQIGGNLYILLLDTYLDLMCYGVQKRLFYQSIGDSDQAQVAIVRNLYTSELAKLGLSDNAKMIERKDNKIRLHRQY